MRVTITLDDELIQRAQQLSGIENRSELIRAALQALITCQSQARLRALRGKLQWEGNLDEMRQGRDFLRQ